MIKLFFALWAALGFGAHYKAVNTPLQITCHDRIPSDSGRKVVLGFRSGHCVLVRMEVPKKGHFGLEEMRRAQYFTIDQRWSTEFDKYLFKVPAYDSCILKMAYLRYVSGVTFPMHVDTIGIRTVTPPKNTIKAYLDTAPPTRRSDANQIISEAQWDSIQKAKDTVKLKRTSSGTITPKPKTHENKTHRHR